MKHVGTALLLLVAFTATASAQTVFLRYKAAPSLKYSLKRTEKISRKHWQGADKDFHYNIDKRLQEKVVKLEDGSLKRKIKQLQGKLTYMDKAVTKAQENPTYVERIDPQGNELALIKGTEGSDPTRMRLVFPKREVAQGATWKYETPPSQTFPAKLTTKYRLAGFKTFRGRKCAYIKSRTVYRGRHPDRNVAAELKSRGHIYFDVEKGLIVNAVSTTRFTLNFLRNQKDGYPKKEQKTIDIRYSLQ